MSVTWYHIFWRLGSRGRFIKIGEVLARTGHEAIKNYIDSCLDDGEILKKCTYAAVADWALHCEDYVP